MKKKRPKKSPRAGAGHGKAGHGKAAQAAPARETAGVFGYDWTLLGLHLLLLVPPFVFVRGVADSFRLPKLVLSGSLALVAIGFLFLRQRRAGGEGWTSFKGSRAVLALAPLLAVAVAGLWTSEHAALVARTLPWLAAGCAFVVAATHLLDEEDRRLALRLTIWPAAALAVIGLLQALDLWQPMEFERRVGARLSITSLAGGAFDLSAYLLLPLILAQERLWNARDRPLRSPKRWIWAVLILLFGGALVGTQTLGSILAAVAGSLALWIHLAWRGDLPRRRLGWVLGGGVAAVAVAVLAVAPVRDRVAKKVRQVERGDVNFFLTGRLDGWRAALWMARERPMTGVGTGAYRAEFGDARLTLQDEGVKFFPGHRQPYFVNAHNELLESLAEWGWPGVLAVLWMLWIIAGGLGGRAPPTTAREDDTDDATAAEASRVVGSGSWPAFRTAATVAIVVVSLTNFPWRLGLIAFPWLLVVASWLDRGAPSGPSARAEDGRGKGILSLVLAALCLAAAVALFGVGKDRIGSQRLVQTAESLALEGARRNSLPPRARDLGLDLLRRAEVLDPADVSVQITRGGLFLVGGRLEAAERSYRQALEMENRAEIWINLARLHLTAGDLDKAADAARFALRLDDRAGRKLPKIPQVKNSKKNSEKNHIEVEAQ